MDRVLLATTLEPGFSFPYKANREFDFDENAESERYRLAKSQQNTWLKDLLSQLPYSAWFIQIFQLTGTAQQVFEWGAKGECVKEFFSSGWGACLWISIQFL